MTVTAKVVHGYGRQIIIMRRHFSMTVKTSVLRLPASQPHQHHHQCQHHHDNHLHLHHRPDDHHLHLYHHLHHHQQQQQPTTSSIISIVPVNVAPSSVSCFLDRGPGTPKSPRLRSATTSELASLFRKAVGARWRTCRKALLALLECATPLRG